MTTNPGTIVTPIIDSRESSAAWNQIVSNQRYLQEIFSNTSPEGLGLDATSTDGVPWTHRNLLDNGGMHSQTRPGAGGTFDASVVDVCPADGWRATFGTWSVDNVNTDMSSGALKCVQTTNAAWVNQTVYNIEQYRGKRVSVWGRAKGKVGHLILNDLDSSGTVLNVNTMQKDASAGWTTYVATITVGATANRLQAWWVSDDPAAGTFWLDNFMMTATDGPVPFQPPQGSYQRVIQRERYFSTHFSHRFHAAAAFLFETVYIPFPLPMLGTPTTSFTAQGTAGVDYGNLSVANTVPQAVDANGVTLVIVAAAAGDCWLYHQLINVDAGVF